MDTTSVVAFCLVAFGLGWSGGAIQRVLRQAVESLD